MCVLQHHGCNRAASLSHCSIPLFIGIDNAVWDLNMVPNEMMMAVVAFLLACLWWNYRCFPAYRYGLWRWNRLLCVCATHAADSSLSRLVQFRGELKRSCCECGLYHLCDLSFELNYMKTNASLLMLHDIPHKMLALFHFNLIAIRRHPTGVYLGL